MKKTPEQTERKRSAALLWESRKFRAFLLALTLLLLLAACFCAAVYIKYRAVIREDPLAELTREAVYQMRSEQPQIGETFRVTALFRVPWNRSPQSVSFQTNEGFQLTAEPEFEFKKYRWGANFWLVSATLQAYRNRRCSPGKFQVFFSGGKEPQVFQFSLPEIEPVLPETGDGGALATAGEIAPEKKTRQWLFILFGLAGAGLLLSVLLVLRDFFRKSRRARIPAPWETALEAVRRLRAAVRRFEMTPEESLSELTLIVRNYLEERFQLRAGHQTTAEFLRDLENSDSLLPDNDRRFLKKFIVAADLVKYARLPSDCTAFENAAVRAGKLILGSVPESVRTAGEKLVSGAEDENGKEPAENEI